VSDSKTPLTDAQASKEYGDMKYALQQMADHARQLEKALRLACRDIAYISGNTTADQYVDYCMKEAKER
jgi:hypothetical protein